MNPRLVARFLGPCCSACPGGSRGRGKYGAQSGFRHSNRPAPPAEMRKNVLNKPTFGDTLCLWAIQRVNIIELAEQFNTGETARGLLEQTLWPDGPACPHCGPVNEAYKLTPRPGVRLTCGPANGSARHAASSSP